MISKRLFVSESILIALLVAVVHLAGTSCSRRLVPASFSNIESRSEEKKLKEFMAGALKKQSAPAGLLLMQ